MTAMNAHVWLMAHGYKFTQSMRVKLPGHSPMALRRVDETLERHQLRIPPAQRAEGTLPETIGNIPA